jgi:serine/threonine protein kinase
LSLAPGTRLGAYEITAPIGAGGMGEVYRGRDTRLDRDVAIKVLPETFASDPERIARFQREAKTLASLNHPHIGAIYGLEDSDGIKALVLELVEGPTLADRIAQGPIPLDEALAIARQMAEALEAAHEHGIIHRDLKPANIKLTSDGTVKVLDFGLAKAVEGHSTPTDLSASPTITSPAMTMGGVILGTAAYMSPEQAKGKPVDNRSDIWAFGCVLYEMLTGKRAFEGEDVPETLALIIKGEIDWTAIPNGIPQQVLRMLRGCFEKDRRLRIPDIAVVRFLVADFSAQAPALVTAARPKTHMLWKVSVSLLAVALVALLIVNNSPSNGAILESTHLSFTPPPNVAVTFGRGYGTTPGPSISPDGRTLAFLGRDASGKVQIWVRPLNSDSAVALDGTDDAIHIFWSPDSRFIGYFAQGRMRRVPKTGGPPQTICAIPSRGSGRGAAWGSSGEIVFNGGPRQLYRVSAGGGEPTILARTTPNLADYSFPAFLPDGKHVLFFAEALSAQLAGVYVISLDGLNPKRIVSADTGAVYDPSSGRILFGYEGTLYSQPFDTQALQVTREPVAITDRIAMSPVLGFRSFSVSNTGTLAYTTGAGGSLSSALQMTWVDRKGTRLSTVGPPGPYRGIDLSPDETKVAAHRHDGEGGDIWVTELTSNTTRRFTFDSRQENSSPVWSPDGSRIAYASLRNDSWGIYAKPVVGTGNEQLFVQSKNLIAPVSWSRDWLVYVASDAKTQYDMWRVSTVDNTKPIPLDVGPHNSTLAQVSPDGKWMAYRSDETGRNQLYVQPFPSGSGKWQVSGEQGSFPRWRRDGRELFFSVSASYGMFMSTTVRAEVPTFEASSPIELFNPDYTNVLHPPVYHPFVVSRDGQRFLIPLARDDQQKGSPSIAVILNWSAVLEKPD